MGKLIQIGSCHVCGSQIVKQRVRRCGFEHSRTRGRFLHVGVEQRTVEAIGHSISGSATLWLCVFLRRGILVYFKQFACFVVKAVCLLIG